MSKDSLKYKATRGVLWSGIDSFSGQGIQFIVTLVLARLLSPSDFGIIGMLSIFLAIAQIFIDSGFSQALIRKKNRTSVDNSTVFFFNVIVSIISYIFLFIISPYVADFYNEPKLKNVMRVLCIILIINSFGTIQRNLFTASLDFRSLAKISLLSSIISGLIAISLAVKGAGVWALVFQILCSAIISTLLLWFYSSWHPKWEYSWSSFRELFSFGSKLLMSFLIGTIFENLYSLAIGKVYNATKLGYYTQAERICKLPSSNITTVMQRVTYPALCVIQDDDCRLRENFVKLLQMSALVIFPLMCFLAGLSNPLVFFLLGDKWSFSASIITPLSFGFMWYPIHALNLNILEVKGRSDLFLRLEVIKRSIGVLLLVLSLPFGIIFLCYSSIIGSLLSLVVNTYYTSKLIDVGFWIQMKKLSKIIIVSLSIFLVVFFITTLFSDNLIQLLTGIIAGGLVLLISTSFLLRDEMLILKDVLLRSRH